MKPGQYFLSLLLGFITILACGAVIALAFVNERQQDRIQLRQQVLNRGMLSPEARQISGQVLNDLGSVAQRSSALRTILQKHGYEVNRPAAASQVATNAPAQSPATGETPSEDSP